MANMKSWMMAAICLCGAGCLASCTGNAGTDKTAADTVAVENVDRGADALAAVNRYMTDSIGKQYAEGEVCIPCVTVVATDEQNPDSILVWGDFWVYNYQVAGDTLKTVSGGSHPGMMCVQKTENGYTVTAFDQVEDGSGYDPSAKRIFGDKYDAFTAVNSDQQKREEARGRYIADYVKANNMAVKYYQDYGWPAVELKFDTKAE